MADPMEPPNAHRTPPPDLPPIPARMLNAYVYCPRLAYLEWVQGEWQDSADTIEGRHRHARVDTPAGVLPEAAQAEAGQESIHARSVTLGSERLGLIARLDLVEGEGGRVIPVDYKRGRRPHVARGAYDPERVQLCAQGLLLREHGYTCEEGMIWYAESRERVRVPLDDELIALTLRAIAELRALAAGGTIPAPLEDSPKCPRCSLVSICLPDEVHWLHDPAQPAPRAIAVADVDTVPLYVQQYHARLGKREERLEVSQDGKVLASVPISEVSQVVLMGNVHVTTPCLAALMDRQITVSWHSYGGWFHGHTSGTGHRNVELRIAQYRAFFDPARCLGLARGLVAAKIANQRTLLGTSRNLPPPCSL